MTTGLSASRARRLRTLIQARVDAELEASWNLTSETAVENRNRARRDLQYYLDYLVKKEKKS